MTASSPAPISPVVRWLAVALVVFTVVLLALGGLTTSRRAGMDDPAWPTEPWYLIVNGSKIDLETRTGFLLEHSHRAAGWVVGGLAAAVAFAAWLSGPGKKSRLPAVVAVFLLLAVYGWFHGQMMAADKLRQATGAFEWPWPSILASAVLAVITVASAVWQLTRRDPARWVRFVATLVLLGVMIQGLLGGLRVFLNSQIGIKDTIGVEFSQLHGLFAQVVFAGMVLLPMLAGPRPAVKELGEPERLKLNWLSVGLVAAVFVQLIWAVWVRHNPSTLSQRLHILTAFVVVGLIIALAMRVAMLPGARKPLGFAVRHLVGMVVVQLLLGVEAWMLKFAAAGPEATIPPMDRAVTTASVLIRTGHQLVGAALLASAVVIAFRVLRAPAIPVPLSSGGEGLGVRGTAETREAIGV
jgi:cytochrome c oxidase assembly protein subunit 15